MTEFSPTEIRAVVEDVRADAVEFLCDLIRFPSISGQEREVVDCAAARFTEVAEVERVPLSNSLHDDEDYADAVPGLEYGGRSNLRLRVAGTGGGPSLLFNTHLDVVPASEGQANAFVPRVEAQRVYGRGACDAKGQVATIYTALAAARRLGMKLRGDVLAHLVVEEEVGGNGTLAMVRAGEHAEEIPVPEGKEMTSGGLVPIDLRGRLAHQVGEWGYVRLEARSRNRAGEESRCYTNPLWFRITGP